MNRPDRYLVARRRNVLALAVVDPYLPVVHVHDVGSIMPSYSSVDYTNDGLGNPVKMSAEANLLTTVLKQQIGGHDHGAGAARVTRTPPTRSSRWRRAAASRSRRSTTPSREARR